MPRLFTWLWLWCILSPKGPFGLYRQFHTREWYFIRQCGAWGLYVTSICMMATNLTTSHGSRSPLADGTWRTSCTLLATAPYSFRVPYVWHSDLILLDFYKTASLRIWTTIFLYPEVESTTKLRSPSYKTNATTNTRRRTHKTENRERRRRKRTWEPRLFNFSELLYYCSSNCTN